MKHYFLFLIIGLNALLDANNIEFILFYHFVSMAVFIQDFKTFWDCSSQKSFQHLFQIWFDVFLSNVQ